MSKIQLPKGTFDVLPYGAQEVWQLSRNWQFVESVCREVASLYGYEEIRTPLYERTELFQRGVGETSDIVMKEMFTFQDRGERWISLRPEGTASVMRAFLENQMAPLKPVHKLFYLGPMFRYERPQSGRYRQHHQFGVEVIGAAKPEQDAEAIDLLFQIYKKLGLRNIKVNVNTVGDTETRARFKEALLSYLKPFFNELSQDSQVRFEKNPLRILDSKDPKDREIIKEAPSILEYLSEPAKNHFQELCHLLDIIQIPYAINDRIVRGLDYYNKTVFEFVTEDLGAQNTIGGGGRYDGLLATFGGPDLAGIGFGTGLERILQVMQAQQLLNLEESHPLIYFIPLGDQAREKCFSLATICRRQGWKVEIDLSAKKMQNSLQNAIKLKATYSAILGDAELEQEMIQLKHMETREQKEIPLNDLLNTMKRLI